MTPEVSELKKVFDHKRKSMPSLGASLLEKGKARSRLNNWVYVSCVLASFLAASVYWTFFDDSLTVESPFALVMWFIFCIFTLALSISNARDSIAAKKLLSECFDADLLEKVGDYANQFTVVDHKLRLCLNPNVRDYLCWYEVFTLMDAGEKEEKSKRLQQAKSDLTARAKI